MKGTHKPPNTWCIPFELSLYDGAQHWYRQLPRKTKRTWTLLSQAFIKSYCAEFTRSAKVRYYSAKRYSKEHVCDCLNRLNGYARNAGVQFEDAGRDAKHHVEHFLDTCDDRGLEECLCHVRVSDIYELEGMIDGILRYRGRNSAREPSLRRYRGQDDDRRREGRSTEGPRSGYDRERGFRDIDRRHDRPRITPLVEALTDVLSALSAKSSDGSRRGSLAVRRHGYDTTEGCGNVGHPYECSRYSDEKSDGGYGSDPTHGRIEAATESKHRVATNGTLDVIRRMELMTPARISRGLFDGTARLLNEAMVALSKFQGNSDDEPHGMQAVVDAMPPEDPSCNDADTTDTFKHRPNETKPMENLENETKLTGYGDKSAFIPDSYETMLTYSEPIGQSRGMDAIQREILITNVPTPPVCNPR
ncbi:hypothetical protein PR003_g26201 [Phytophthora rubi]|uniref:Retrotransposon gag domain-containing protein n=1 Tax=Phytophthora rubi TaxID=129364 RepID=A0A6A4CBL6_9STRA|nr:hypothetical protein PR003_g26201 [Phytophthora rubi]